MTWKSPGLKTLSLLEKETTEKCEKLYYDDEQGWIRRAVDLSSVQDSNKYYLDSFGLIWRYLEKLNKYKYSSRT